MQNSPKKRVENPRQIDPEKYARLKAEAVAPYRGLRRFVYLACGASGGIGAIIFLLQLIAGENVGTILPNLALQIGVVALMVWLFRIDRPKDPK